MRGLIPERRGLFEASAGRSARGPPRDPRPPTSCLRLADSLRLAPGGAPGGLRETRGPLRKRGEGSVAAALDQIDSGMDCGSPPGRLSEPELAVLAVPQPPAAR